MTFKEIKELIKLLDESNLKEFRLKNKDFELRVRTDKDEATVSVPATQIVQPTAPPPSTPAPAPVESAPPGNSRRKKSRACQFKSD